VATATGSRATTGEVLRRGRDTPGPLAARWPRIAQAPGAAPGTFASRQAAYVFTDLVALGGA